MKTKTKTVTIAAAAASVIAAADVVDARDLQHKTKSGKRGKQSCIPNPDDLQYGAACVEKKDHAIACGDKSNAKSSKKGKAGKPLYYDGEDDGEGDCVEAKDLDVAKCGDHSAVYENDEADCKIVDEGSAGCKTAEMCAQRHAKGESCVDCGAAGKIHGCAGCPNEKSHRGLMADAW